MTMFAGLDVGFKRTAICGVDERGETVWRGIVDRPEDAVASLHRRHARLLEGKDPLNQSFRLVLRDVGLRRHRHLTPVSAAALQYLLAQNSDRGVIVGILGGNGLERRADHFPLGVMAGHAVLAPGQIGACIGRRSDQHRREKSSRLANVNHKHDSIRRDTALRGIAEKVVQTKRTTGRRTHRERPNADAGTIAGKMQLDLRTTGRSSRPHRP